MSLMILPGNVETSDFHSLCSIVLTFHRRYTDFCLNRTFLNGISMTKYSFSSVLWNNLLPEKLCYCRTYNSPIHKLDIMNFTCRTTPQIVFSILLLFTLHEGRVALSNNFSVDCPPSRCSSLGPEIRYPLRLNSSPSFCGFAGLEISCTTANNTILVLPSSRSYNVTAVDYREYAAITINGSDLLGYCPLQSLPIINITHPMQNYYRKLISINCSEKINVTQDLQQEIAGPIPCLSRDGYFGYAVDRFLPMHRVPSDCVVMSYVGVPYLPGLLHNPSLQTWIENFTDSREITLKWPVDGLSSICVTCGSGGKSCGFNRTGNETTCFELDANSTRIGTKTVIIAGTAGLFAALLSHVIFTLLHVVINDREKKIRRKVERFLAAYRTTTPTRYTYIEIKKITQRFKHKLGQGGFGTVYRGELPDGIPVAVKILKKYTGNGEEFINEVATAGMIHHVNVVRLLGFCSEGARRALVYEFMPNESLEKFIFSRESMPLSWEKLLDIALGIARGMEYLHQGCSQQILHFDIKPHNILLDHDFNPKISDFGLAKLCARDDLRLVSMTAARGTLGYIAPEIYSRNFGIVSNKSDVYSFGILLMEMVGGQRHVNPSVQTQSQFYFPEWIYSQLVQGEELGLGLDMQGSEEIARKLAIAALWCIQWNPIDRPSMAGVILMLTENAHSLQIPPTPFVSFSAQ